MNFDEWKTEQLDRIQKDLMGRGFVPETCMRFVAKQEMLIDIAYQYGIKEAGNDIGED